MDRLHSKSTILAAIKSGLTISGDNWLLRSMAGEILADVDGREPRLFPLNAAGLESALEWIRLPF